MHSRIIPYKILVIFLMFLLADIDLRSQPADDKIKTNNADKKLKVAVISSESKFCDVHANISHFEQLIASAAQKGVRLVCFPELALTSYTLDPAVLEVAAEIPGSLTVRLAQIASSHNVYLSIGMAEKYKDKYYITQVVVGPKGYIGKYRKHHPTPGEQKSGFSPGESFPIFDIDGFKLGINICNDGRFLDTIETMKKAGVDIIHHPHGNWKRGANAEEWTRGKMVYFVFRAIYSRAYILINNSAGDTVEANGRTMSFGSGAMVIDPLGQATARTKQKDHNEKVLFATLAKLSTLIPSCEVRRLDEPFFHMTHSDYYRGFELGR